MASEAQESGLAFVAPCFWGFIVLKLQFGKDTASYGFEQELYSNIVLSLILKLQLWFHKSLLRDPRV